MKKNKNKNKSELSTKNRKELQELCKQYNIKGNITTENMVKCIDFAMMKKNFKQSWVELHKDALLITISFTALIMSIITLFYLLFRHNQ